MACEIWKYAGWHFLITVNTKSKWGKKNIKIYNYQVWTAIPLDSNVIYIVSKIFKNLSPKLNVRFEWNKTGFIFY